MWCSIHVLSDILLFLVRLNFRFAVSHTRSWQALTALVTDELRDDPNDPQPSHDLMTRTSVLSSLPSVVSMHHLSTPRILLEIPTSVPCNLQCVLLLNFVHVSKTCSHDDSKSSEPRCRDAVGWLPLASENPLDPVREGFRHDTPDSFVLGESSARQCFLKR